MATKGNGKEDVQAAGEIILNSIKRRTYRRGQYGCGGWLHSPAALELFALTIDRLLELAAARKVDLGPEQKISMLRAVRRAGGKRVWIYPTHWNDPQGIPVKEVSGRMTANLYDFMAEAGWLVEIGHSERYALQDAVAEDPAGEFALWFDVDAPQERKLNSKGRAAARTKAEKAEAKAKAEAAAKAKAEAAARARAEAEAATRAEAAAKDETPQA